MYFVDLLSWDSHIHWPVKLSENHLWHFVRVGPSRRGMQIFTPALIIILLDATNIFNLQQVKLTDSCLDNCWHTLENVEFLLTWHLPSRSRICSSFSFMSMLSFLHSVSSSRMRPRKESVDSTLLDRREEEKSEDCRGQINQTSDVSPLQLFLVNYLLACI